MAFVTSFPGNPSWIAFAIDVSIKVSLLFAVAVLVTTVLRRNSAAVRHRIWSLAFCGALLVPLLSAVVPQWEIPILPHAQTNSAGLSNELTARPDLASAGNPTHELRRPESLATDPMIQQPPRNTTPRVASNQKRDLEETKAIDLIRSVSTKTSALESVIAPELLLIVIWVVGFTISCLPLLGGVVQKRLLLIKAHEISHPNEAVLLRQLCAELGVSRSVRLFELNADVVPMTWGIFHPVILLPESCATWSRQRRRIVLLHELSHVKRLDFPCQILARLVCTIYWFNPLSWYALWRFRIEREIACDDCVVNAGERASDYASELVDIAETYRAAQWVAAVAMARTTRLEGRVRCLFDRTKSHRPLTRPLALGLSVAATLLVLFAVAVHPVQGTTEENGSTLQQTQNAIGSTETKPRKTTDALGDPLPSAKSERQEPATRRIDIYGDPLPQGAIARLGTERYRHSGWSKRLHFLSDSKKLLSFSPSPHSRVRLFEARTGKLLHVLKLGGRELEACEPSADGKFLATLAWKFDREKREYHYKLELWDTQTWKTRLVAAWMDAPGRRATCLAYAPSGATIVAGGERGKLRFFDVASGEEVLNYSVTKQEIKSMEFSPDSSFLAMAGNDGAFLWDWRSGDEPEQLKAIPRNAQTVVFSPNGKLLAIGNQRDDFAARLWNVASRRIVAQLKGEATSYYREGLAFSPDGKLLAVPTSDANKVEIFDVGSGKLLRRLDAKVETRDVAISADGRLLATGGSAAAIKVFDLLTGQVLGEQSVGHDSRIYDIEFMPNGKRVVTSSQDGTIRLWDANTGRQIRRLKHGYWVTGLAMSPDPQRIASLSMDDTLRLWDTRTGKQLLRLPGHGKTGGSHGFAVGFSPDGRRLFSFGKGDGLLRVRNAQSGEVIGKHQIVASRAEAADELGFDSDSTLGARFTADGKTLLIAFAERLEFYDVESGRELERFRFDDELLRFSVSQDGKLLATLEQRHVNAENTSGQGASGRRTWLRLRDFNSKKVFREIEVPSSSWPWQIEFSPNGRLLAASLNRLTANGRSWWTSVWETKTGNEYARVKGYSGQPIALAFSPDGKRLASSYFDTPAVLIWDLDQFRVGR